MTVSPNREKRRVVIIGAGFAGLSAAKELADAPVSITVIDRRNYHLFQPLLYQVATAGLSPADIASPIRGVLRRQKNATVLMGKVNGIDCVGHRVITEEGAQIPYDYLIVATGARHAYFGKGEWEPFAPGLKKIDDATDIRRRILLSFERAETAVDLAERRRQLTFAIIGGGPTGVEMAGAIAELARKALARDFRNIDPCAARVVLVQSAARVLPNFSERMSDIALRSLKQLGVEVRTGARVNDCGAYGITVGEEVIPAGTVVWAAGVAGSQAAKWLNAERDQAGRVIVGPDLTVPGQREIMVIGDTAAITDAAGKSVPSIAPAAKQAGCYAARVILADVSKRSQPRPFRYRHFGNLATIGRQAAVAEFGPFKLWGRPAWFLWGAAHVWFLVGFRSRMKVLLEWLWCYVTFHRGARLITGPTYE